MLVCTLQACAEYYQNCFLILEDPVIDMAWVKTKIINPGESINREVK
jgi:hypothetical protein